MRSLSKLAAVGRAIALASLLTLSCHASANAVVFASSSDAAEVERLSIDARAPGRPFPHFWETTFGSGHAVLALRANYQRDLSLMRSATGIGYVRFHGILDDEVGLGAARTDLFYDGPRAARSPYNFSYVDQIYDALLAQGVRPFVEIDFMPTALAANPDMLHSFWYHPNVSPPRSYASWDRLIRAFARHRVARYGIDEVARWYFEVWNEPNLDFWGGAPRQQTYFKLYDHTAHDLKDVSPRLRVGGPATAQTAWLHAFLAHVARVKAPIDFVSTHVYANDTAENVFGTEEKIGRQMMVCRAVSKVHGEIERSQYPRLPLIMSEFNASYANEPDVTDTPYMGPWMASTISQCDGLTEAMSYWTFSDVFEEGGVVRTPFYGGFGLIAEDDIPKAAFNAFSLLHQLGNVRLDLTAQSALITRTPAGDLAIALWNYAPPDGTGPRYTPPPATRSLRTFDIDIHGVSPAANGMLWRVDDRHGNVLQTYDAMGRPSWPTPAQIAILRRAGRQPPPERISLDRGRIRVRVPQHGLVLLQILKPLEPSRSGVSSSSLRASPRQPLRSSRSAPPRPRGENWLQSARTAVR